MARGCPPNSGNPEHRMTFQALKDSDPASLAKSRERGGKARNAKYDERVTYADIARRAGVSKVTVSRALNGLDEISEATRARIRRIAEEMGYSPQLHSKTDDADTWWLHCSAEEFERYLEELGV